MCRCNNIVLKSHSTLKKQRKTLLSVYLILMSLFTVPIVAANMQGDVAPLGNPDSNITVADALVTLRMALNLIEVDLNADVAPLGAVDGKVTVADALVTLRVSLNLTSYPSESLEAMVSRGLDEWHNNDFSGTKILFAEAYDLAGNSSTNTADTARFFNALSRVGWLFVEDQSDGDLTTIDMFGDLLAVSGCTKEFSLITYRDEYVCPTVLPNSAPSMTEFQTILDDTVGVELLGALNGLAQITDTFQRSWSDNGVNPPTEYDYGDVLLLQAAYQLSLAIEKTQAAYGLDWNYRVSDYLDIQTFLTQNPDFLKLLSATKAIDARGYFVAALHSYQEAIYWVQAETDDQGDDFFHLLGTLNFEIQNTLVDIDDALALLNGQKHRAEYLGQQLDIDLKALFEGVDIRAALPNIVGNEITGLFPDTTFSGVLSGDYDANQDLDEDGIPDILQFPEFDIDYSDIPYNTIIPSHFTCDGVASSPAIYWSGVPFFTQSFALVMEDTTTNSSNLIAFNLPHYGYDSGGVYQGQAANIPIENMGINGLGVVGYQAPCPTAGTGLHQYSIKIYALDSYLSLSSPTKSVLESAIQGHILGVIELKAQYER